MNRIELTIPSDLVFERIVRASTAELAAQLDLSNERIEDLKLAVSEAVTNAIEHGNQESGNPTASVDVIFAIDNEKLEVHIRDHGAGVERINFDRRVVDEEHLDAGMLRGFGMYLISELVDQYEVQSSPEGTVMILRIFRGEPPQT